ncbi:MAG: T9SS type A sorting domain-containing protein [Chitinophagaceae bacterium]|nr:T9SS type A sorting domain-containing protein [Chitinophagaceae bacterium]
MRTILYFLLLLWSAVATGQSFECYKYGQKNYYCNSYGYLRGIRVDSGYTSPDSLVLHPYRSPRCREPLSSASSRLMDTAGASWLGRKSVMFPDGTFYTLNMWGDSIIIKTRSAIGDTWIFHHDTTQRRYLAEMTGKSVMSVLGGPVDSIRRIRIYAYDDTGLVPSAPLNNFEMIITGNSGFYQIFDLYTFPYHPPGQPYVRGTDYFLDKIMSQASPARITKENFIFTRCDPTPFPNNNHLYSFAIKDKFEYAISDYAHPGNGTYPYRYWFFNIDSIAPIPGGFEYSYTGWLATQSYSGTYIPNFKYPYTKEPVNGKFGYYLGDFTDPTIMPEEHRKKDIIYYFPDGRKPCNIMKTYGSEVSKVADTTWPDVNDVDYYVRYDLLRYGLSNHKRVNTSVSEYYDTVLVHCSSVGSFSEGDRCGALYDPTFVDLVRAKSDVGITVTPNPANETLHITFASTGTYKVAVVNYLGQCVATARQSAENEITIDASRLATGVYMLVASDNDGNRHTQRISIVH